MAWTNLSFAYGSVLTSAKMTQMYDNFSYGTGSSTPAFQVGTTSSTEAVGSNNTRLATTAFCEAGFVNNDVGALGIGMVIMAHYSTPTTVASGATVSGANLLYMSGAYAIGSGTWRNVSGVTLGGTYSPLPFQRIA